MLGNSPHIYVVNYKTFSMELFCFLTVDVEVYTHRLDLCLPAMRSINIINEILAYRQ